MLRKAGKSVKLRRSAAGAGAADMSSRQEQQAGAGAGSEGESSKLTFYASCLPAAPASRRFGTVLQFMRLQL